jgi:hypothetical protein
MMKNGCAVLVRTASKARRIAMLTCVAFVIAFLQAGLGQTANVLTQHNDLSRDGANPNETILTTSNVNTNAFGMLFTLPIDGWEFAQPLYASGVTIAGQGTHNILYIATENDSVYAFDADSGTQYWRASLGTPAPSSVVNSPTVGPVVGITSTPVIDLSSGTLFAAGETFEDGVQMYRLYALDITTGAEKFGGPVAIEGSIPGSAPDGSGGAVSFVAAQELQRPALTLVNGIVYLAFGSHDDIYPYHGWLLGYSATTLKQVQVFNVTPNSGQGAVWMAGQGLVADSSNNLYVTTSNSTQNLENSADDFGESFLKLVPGGSSLTVGDYFKPNNYDTLNAEDADLGSGGAFAIPGTSLIVGGGKQGLIYVIDTNNMGKLDTSADQVLQEFQAESGLWGSPAFFNDFMYVWGINDSLRAYEFSPSGKYFYTATQGAYVTGAGQTGGAVSVSSNGTNAGTAIVWATAPTADPSSGLVPGNMFAYDATNLQSLLWSTLQNPLRDGYGNWAKFVAPTVANGKVYVATGSKQVAVYGLLSSETDFSINISTPNAAVLRGGSTVVSFTVTPVNAANFQASVALAANGLPQGATYAFSPASIAAGASQTVVNLTMNIPQSQSYARPGTMRPGAQFDGKTTGSLVRKLAPFSLAFGLLPFASRLRGSGHGLGRMPSILIFLVASMAPLAGICACGSATSIPASQQENYVVTITATSGAFSHSTTIVLSVQ